MKFYRPFSNQIRHRKKFGFAVLRPHGKSCLVRLLLPSFASFNVKINAGRACKNRYSLGCELSGVETSLSRTHELKTENCRAMSGFGRGCASSVLFLQALPVSTLK
jgi:hypothetical protein